MKKHSLLIIVGGFFLVLGLALSFIMKKNNPIYYEEGDISVEEANSLILEKTKNIVEVFENQKETFKVVSENKSEEASEEAEYIKVNNYDDVIDNLYTENGKEELETLKFNNKSFVNKKDDEVYILAKIPDNNLYTDTTIIVNEVEVNKDEVTGKVIFSYDELVNNELTYYVYEKDIKLIKIDDKWLVETFIYPNK